MCRQETSQLPQKPIDPAYFLAALLFLLTFWRFIPVGFTDHDSMYMAIRWAYGDAFFAWGAEQAADQGRLSHYFISYLGAIPLLFKSFWWYKFTLLTTLAANAVVFYYLTKKYTNSRSLALLSAVVLLAVLRHSPNHSLLTGYFVYFQVFLLLIMLSLLFFKKYLEDGQYRHLALSVLLYTLTFGREDTLLYFTFFVLMAVFERAKGGWRESAKRILLPLIPFCCAALFYFSVFLLFRLNHPSNYAGNTINWDSFSISSYFHTLWKYTISVFPLYLLAVDEQYAQLIQFYSESSSGLKGMLSELRVEWIARAAIAAYLTTALALRGRFDQRKAYWLFGLSALLFLIIPNAPLSLSGHYQNLAAAGTRTLTHYTYYVCFGVSMLFVWLIAGAMGISSKRGAEALARPVACGFGLLIALFSLETDYTNHYIVISQQLTHKKWETLDHFFATDTFKDIPKNSLIYAPSLWDSPYTVYYTITDYSGAHLIPLKENEPNYWEKYCASVSGKELLIVNEMERVRELADENGNLSGDVYYLRFAQEPKDLKQILVFSKITELSPVEESIYSNHVEVFSYSKNRTFQVQFKMRGPAEVMQDGEPVTVHGDTFSATVDKLHDSAIMPLASFTAPGIDLDTVTVSYFPETLTIRSIELLEDAAFLDLLEGKPSKWLASSNGVFTNEGDASSPAVTLTIHPDPNGKNVLLSQEVPIGPDEAGARIRARVEAKTSETKKLALNLYIISEGENQFSKSVSHPGSDAWTVLEHEVLIPDNIGQASIRMLIAYRAGATSTAHIRRASLRIIK